MTVEEAVEIIMRLSKRERDPAVLRRMIEALVALVREYREEGEQK